MVVGEADSDQETKTSLSEDISMEHDRRSSAGSGKNKRASKLEDSDFEFDNEILLEGETEHSRLRRGFAHLKSKVKAKHAAHQAQKTTLSTATAANTATVGSHAAVTAVKKDISPSRSTGSSSSSTSLRGNILRRRKNKGVETAELASPTNMSSALAATVAASGEMAAVVPVVVSGKPAKKTKSETVGKRDIEIESGVEMLEDMIPPPAPTLPTDDTSPDSGPPKRIELNLPIQTDSPSFKGYTLRNINMLSDNDGVAHTSINYTLRSATDNKANQSENPYSFWINWYHFVSHAKYLPCISILLLVVMFFLPINDFIKGVLSCLLSITIVDGLWNFIQEAIEYYTITFKPEKNSFHIPDYSKMTICEVPAVKEYKTVKSYGVNFSLIF